MVVKPHRLRFYLLLILGVIASFSYVIFQSLSIQEFENEEIELPTSEYVTSESNDALQDIYSNNNDIPREALQTLLYIRKYDKAPKGYEGGRQFMNRERRLPHYDSGQLIFYREWDIYPKIKGQNRGPKRLVTSSVKAYYTPDHYKTFREIKE